MSSFLPNGITCSAIVAALIEWQEVCGRSSKASRHEDEIGIDRKMNQGASLEFENDFSRVAVLLVLNNCVLDGLPRELIFEFQSGDRNAVHAKGNIK